MSELSLDDLREVSQAVHALREMPSMQRREIRDSAGISRSVLADLLGVSPDRVKAYEEGALPLGENARRYYKALEAMTPENDEMPAEERERAKAYFQAGEVCAHCRGVHNRACPRVKRMKYHENSTLAEVEFWADGQWPIENVIFIDSPEMSE